MALWLNDEPLEVTPQPPVLRHAQPTGKFPISQKQKAEFGRFLHQKDFEIEKAMVQAKENPFQLESANIQGEFENDLAKLSCSSEIKNLIVKYREVFGPLPPHKKGEGCTLVAVSYTHLTLPTKA